MKHFKNLKLNINLRMNLNLEEKFQKCRINSNEANRTLQAVPTNKNILFYRKTFVKNNKSSFIYRKKGKNNSNITPNSNLNYISGYKKKSTNINYGSEETNQSTKGKTIKYSKHKPFNKSKNDEITPEKYLNNKSISPFSIHSNDSNKENKSNQCLLNNKNKKPSIIKYNLRRKGENLSLNYTSKIQNITINNEELKKNMIFEGSLEVNNKHQNLNLKNKKLKPLRNFAKNAINITFNTNKNKEPINILSHNIVQSFHNSINKYNDYNNTNTIIINNTIKRNNSNYLGPNKMKKTHLTINNNVFDINNIHSIETGKRNLVKGKIIKFKYNGTEFFFEPIHNKTENDFYKRNPNYNKEVIIKAANLIKKWWKHIIFINILKEKIQIKDGIYLMKKFIKKLCFKKIRYKVMYLKEIIYIQKKWKEFLYSKNENNNHYIKHDVYGCDNSYRKKKDNFYSNNLDYNYIYNNSSEKQTKVNNNYTKLNKKINLISNNFFSNLSKKSLIPSNRKVNYNKIEIKKNGFYSKKRIKIVLDKIIFIQRKIRVFLRNLFCSKIRNIYKTLYLSKIKKEEFDINNTMKLKKNKYSQTMKISNQNFYLISKKKNNQKQSYNIKKEVIHYQGNIQKYKNNNYCLFIDKINQIQCSSKIRKNKSKLKICNNQNIKIYPIKKKAATKSKNEINFSIIKSKQKQDLALINNKPILNKPCFYYKIIIDKKYIIKNKKEIPIKTIIKTYCVITKINIKNDNNLPYIIKIQNSLKSYIKKKEENIILKPINDIIYITKIRKKNTKIKRIYKIKRNNSFKTLKKNGTNGNNQTYYNNIEEFMQDNDGEKINDVTKYNTINNSHRKNNNEKERNSNLLNDTDENKNDTPIRIMNAKIHKSSINYNPVNITNLKTIKNSYNVNHKYINIESLPSINSLRTNTENNDLFAPNPSNNNKNNNINTSVSIQTLGSNISNNKFNDNNVIKRIITEANNYHKSEIEYENKNYFYTENDINKFSFKNEKRNIFENSILRKNTANYSNFILFINLRIIKLFFHKIKEIKSKKCIYVFIQMLIQRVKKNINVFVFNNICERNNKNDFYKIIRKHIRIYNKINSEEYLKNKHKNNEIIILIRENIFIQYLQSKFIFLSDDQEKIFIQKNIFISNDKDLINYFLIYYRFEYKPIDIDYINLIQFRLIKEPLNNMNIFSITKYMDKLYYNIIHGNICKNCFCKKEESCSINCNCHIKLQKSINLINRLKNWISHHKSINENKDNNSFIEERPKNYERNIRIIIKKVKRTSADRSRTANNSGQNSDSKNSNSNDIDIFQKMNEGIESIINKVKINKAFKDINLERKKQIDRTCTEFNGEMKQKKVYSDTLESGYYSVKNHFATPNKKYSTFLFEKKLFS